MNILVTTILGLALIIMAISAIIIAYGWLGLLVYFCIGALLLIDRITKERRRHRDQYLIDGSWWRDVA